MVKFCAWYTLITCILSMIVTVANDKQKGIVRTLAVIFEIPILYFAYCYLVNFIK